VNIKSGLLAFAVMVIIAISPLSSACSDVYVLPGEHIVLQGHPTGSYNYLWSSTAMSLTEDSLPATTSLATLTFDAPTTSGDYQVNLLVTSSVNGASACSASSCVKVHVCDTTCFEPYANYCTHDSANWCITPCHWDGTLTWTWYVNKVLQTTGSALTSDQTCYSVTDLTGSQWIQPTESATSKVQTVAVKVTQPGNGHTHVFTTPINCTKTFNLIYNPAGSTSITTTSPQP